MNTVLNCEMGCLLHLTIQSSTPISKGEKEKNKF